MWTTPFTTGCFNTINVGADATTFTDTQWFVKTPAQSLWPPYVCNMAGHYIFSCGFFLFSFFLLSFFPRVISAVADWMSTMLLYKWCGPSANLECRSVICCTRLAGNAEPKIIAKNSPSWHHRTTMSGHIFATKAIRKKLLNSNIYSTCSDNMVNFGPLTAEIGSGVWGHPYKFQRVLHCISAALLHGI